MALGTGHYTNSLVQQSAGRATPHTGSTLKVVVLAIFALTGSSALRASGRIKDESFDAVGTVGGSVQTFTAGRSAGLALLVIFVVALGTDIYALVEMETAH